MLLRFKNELVGVLIDRFGSDIPIHPSWEAGWSETRAEVAVSSQFFGWIFGLGGDVMITGPESVREDYIRYLKTELEKYAG